MWQDFFNSYNEVFFSRDNLLVEAEIQVISDAMGLLGFCVYFRGYWLAEDWPQEWFHDFTFIDFFLVVAVRIWDTKFSNSTVHFWCNSLAAVNVINSQVSKSLRVMVLVSFYSLVFVEEYIISSPAYARDL